MDNENNDNNNDNVEAIRARLRAEDGGKGKLIALPGDKVKAEKDPTPRDFAVGLRNKDGEQSGELDFPNAFLFITGTFVGFADADGVMLGVVPMENLLFVKADVEAPAA